MATYKKQHALAAQQLGLRAARRMALLSATIPFDQVEPTCQQESEVLDLAITVAAEEFALLRDAARRQFEAAVGKALNEETDRISSRITRGTRSPQ